MAESIGENICLPLVGRFAPSPTGPLHLGSLVAAVGSYLMVKSLGGRWLLRIEDLDTPRVLPGIADEMLRTLEILGFQWDGEVIFQSRRTKAYLEALAKLRERGCVYPCSCSRAEIARIGSAPHDGEEGPAYPGTCRDGLPRGKHERAVRVKVTDQEISFTDNVMGEFRQVLSLTCGDFVVKRADGPFAYHLAVVVDDAESGVTQVVRGADLLGSTPLQIYLQMLLGYPTPLYSHLPLVAGPDGGKLSKRDNALSISSCRKNGGELILAALKFLGQTPPAGLQKSSCREILSWGCKHFDPALIPVVSAPLLIPS